MSMGLYKVLVVSEDNLMRQGSDLVYFMHIDKNAGTTMRHILSMNYPAEAFLDTLPLGRMGIDGRAKTVDGLDEDVYQIIAEVQNRQQVLACVAANLPFGLDKFLDRPVAYFTFLREPISRCISYWYFAFQTRHRAPLWSVLESYDFDLYRIFRDHAAYQFSNDQVRMVSGSSVPDPGETELRLACEIIKERFFLAGAIEYFDPCLRVLARQFGWHDTSYIKQNVGIKIDPSLLPARAEKCFREANEWDIRLYEWLVNDYLPQKLT